MKKFESQNKILLSLYCKLRSLAKPPLHRLQIFVNSPKPSFPPFVDVFLNKRPGEIIIGLLNENIN